MTGLPYPEDDGTRTAGWSGSDASHDRAREEALSGTATKRQRAVLIFLAARGSVGATWKEVSENFGWHHGQSSGALSGLHKEGQIARLVDRRERCSVYVLHDYVQERETAVAGRAKRNQRSFDEGWQEGYDAGAAAPRAVTAIEQSILEAERDHGVAIGRRGAAHAVIEVADALTRDVIRVKNPLLHHKTCYREHPACAIAAVRKAAIRAGGVPLDSGPAGG